MPIDIYSTSLGTIRNIRNMMISDESCFSCKIISFHLKVVIFDQIHEKTPCL